MYSLSLFLFVCRGLYYIYVVYIHLHILVSYTISISADARVINCNTTGAISGTGTAYHYESHHVYPKFLVELVLFNL